MHMYGRASFAFDSGSIAALRAVFSPGPLQLLQAATALPRPPGSSRSDSEKARAARKAAVLVPLCNHDGIASLLFTVRSSEVSTHKGQVSFPGGHLEPGEDAIGAALRETREEIGDSLGEIEVLGTCQTLPAVTGTPVTSVVAFLQKDVGLLLPELVLSPEVERVFTLSISELLDPYFRATDDLGPRGKLPAFTAGPSRVWGLTAVIADGVLRNGIVPALEQAAVAPLAEGDNVGGGGARRRHGVSRDDKGPGSSSL